MNPTESNQINNTFEFLWQYTTSLSRSVKMLRWLGYGFLMFTVFDLVAIVVPPDFTNPVWEFETMGAMVDSVAIPLIGLALVFIGERKDRFKWEKIVLPVLSRLALVTGVLYLVLIMLGISSAVRIDRQNTQQLSVRVNQTSTQIQQIQEQLAKVTTTKEMEDFLSRLYQNNRALSIKDQKQFEQVKEQLEAYLTRGESQLKTQTAKTKSNQRLNVLKNALKWNLGALLSAVLFWILWRGSTWTQKWR